MGTAIIRMYITWLREKPGEHNTQSNQLYRMVCIQNTIIMRAIVISRLDYCNPIYVGLPLKNVWKLQFSSAVTKISIVVCCRDCTSACLIWLPFSFQEHFKVLMLTDKLFMTLEQLSWSTTYSLRNLHDQYGHFLRPCFRCPSHLRLGNLEGGLLSHGIKIWNLPQTELTVTFCWCLLQAG